MAGYLITGGGGFIGSNITRYLVERGEKVRILDNFSTGKRENLAGLEGKIELVEGDIRDVFTVMRSLEGIDYILHQAALPSVPRSVADPLTTNNVNLIGTLNLLEAAKDFPIKRLVIASSSSVYGDTDSLPKKESLTPAPLSPYAASKLAVEYYAKVFHNVYGVESVILRYFNIFGPNQDPTSQYSAVVPKFITSILQDKPVTIFGDGEQSRDFTFVDNVVSANILAAKADSISGEVINIASGVETTVNELIETIETIVGKKAKRVYLAERAGDVKHSLADISKAKKLLGYSVTTDLKRGLKKSIEFFKRADREV
ncbi:MAG: LPS biosynthesis protein WbpP [candidate division Zixibacteria bacterium 4484_93]|nr:MAG: LPS biosynthesis protein WbpP [candidate division Zixibacteria bacterium 4484_93]